MGNLVIDSGTYDIAAVGYEKSSSAVGILTGDNAEVTTMGNLTINGGNIDVTAYNSDYAGAFGLFAFGESGCQWVERLRLSLIVQLVTVVVSALAIN